MSVATSNTAGPHSDRWGSASELALAARARRHSPIAPACRPVRPRRHKGSERGRISPVRRVNAGHADLSPRYAGVRIISTCG